MCQAKVFLEHNGDRELIMDEVIHLLVEGETVWVSRLLEQPVAVRAIVKEADFLKHTVTLIQVDDGRSE